MQRTRVMESRAYDAHYDPVFTHSGDRPRAGGIPAWSNSVTAVNAGAPSKGNYRSAPRSTIQFRATQQATVPAIMPDGTIGRMPAPAAAAGTTAAPPRVMGLNGPMSAEQVAGQLASEVRGRSRVKFFKRPVVPFLEGQMDLEATAQSSEALMAQAAAAQEAAAAAARAAQAQEPTRTLGTQSDYRESDTQTDPYTPDYITAPEEPEPEILGLAHLTYGQGLPASMDELRLIRRMREKKIFEASLPPITDAASFEKRKALLEARELSEWALREEEMKADQAARLEVLIDSLKARESKVEELAEARVDLVRTQKLQERDLAFDQIHRERIKLHRAIGKNRVGLDADTAHMSGGYKELTSSHVSNRRTGLRDIVSEYADHSSQVYAPIQHRGKLPVKNQVVDYGIPLINNFQGLVELEAKLPAHALGVKVRPPALRKDGKGIEVESLATRKGQAIRADLDYVDNLLALQRAEGGAVGITGDARTNYGRRGRPLIENVYKKFEPVQRAATPEVERSDDDDATRAILLLQRLLRGRMVQNAMYEGKSHHAALIAELRMEEQLPQEIEDEQDEVSIAHRRRRTRKSERGLFDGWLTHCASLCFVLVCLLCVCSVCAQPLHHALDTLQGELVSSAFDFVSKELVRCEQERVVSALVAAATLDRRHREAEESGRRQAEAVLRAKRERQLREVMDDHALTADRFMEEMVSGAVRRFAETNAAKDAEAAEAATAAASAASKADTEFVVGDLVASFLLPEVERRKDARKAELQDRRFIKLAHEAVFAAVAGLQPGGAGGAEEEEKEEAH